MKVFSLIKNPLAVEPDLSVISPIALTSFLYISSLSLSEIAFKAGKRRKIVIRIENLRLYLT
jgi:hypothetical protein